MNTSSVFRKLRTAGHYLCHGFLTLILLVTGFIVTSLDTGWNFINWLLVGLPLALAGLALDLLFLTSRLRDLPVFWMKIAVLVAGIPAFYLFLWESQRFPLYVLLAAVLVITTLRGQICQWKRLLAAGAGLLPFLAILLYFAFRYSLFADHWLLFSAEILLVAGVLYSATKYHLLTVIGYSAAECFYLLDSAAGGITSPGPVFDMQFIGNYVNLLLLLFLFLIRAVTLLPGYTEDPYIAGPQSRYSLYRHEDYIGTSGWSHQPFSVPSVPGSDP